MRLKTLNRRFSYSAAEMVSQNAGGGRILKLSPCRYLLRGRKHSSILDVTVLTDTGDKKNEI